MKPVLLLCVLAQLAVAQDAASTFSSRVQPLLKTYCTECHAGAKPKSGVQLAGPRTADQLAAERDQWFRVLDALEAGTMPPKDEKQPTPAERAALVAWLRDDFTNALLARQRADGRSKLRRLSRTEYANTIFDLFGVKPAVGLNLPTDGRVDGYDKVAAALPLSASGAAGYFKMADDILARMLRPIPKTPPKPRVTKKATTDFDDVLGDKKPEPSAGGLQPPSTASVSPFDPARTVRAIAFGSEQSKGHILELPDGTKVSFNTDTTSGPLRGFGGPRNPGVHRLRLSVYAYQTDKPLPFGIFAGHTGAYPQIIELVAVLEAPPGKPTVLETEIYLRTSDLNDLAPINDNFRLIPFGLGVPVPKNTQASACRAPGLAVQWVEIEEPELPLAGDRWIRADFRAALAGGLQNRDVFIKAAEATFKRITPRLFRRDPTAEELTRLNLRFAEQLDVGVTADNALRDFLCIVEQPGPLNDFALASRLAYFLWNSTPDEALLAVAREGKLRDGAVLAAQTERLLKDPRASRFVDDFTDQWLGLRAIDDTSPDSKLYPEYAKNDLLKRSSVQETRAFFRRVLDENLSVREFAAANWTFANESLAKHYGLPGITSLALQKVSLPADSAYGGLWTQPAVLKVTANGTYTSPVKRGVWVAERLLGTPIPPPPPNTPAVEPDIRGAKTLREQLALHSSQGSCAACHAKFDPYGFALESFDVTGSYRKNYRVLNPERKSGPWWTDGLAVDCSGKTPAGQTFSDIRELRKVIAQNPAQLARGVTRHLVTYATGAPATRLDQPAIDAIVTASAKDNHGLRSLIHGIVQSELFRSK
jgi:mono/diheme cytochrome c family protein